MAFKSVLDPEFTYRNAASTDIRLTFERIRREQEGRSGNSKVKAGGIRPDRRDKKEGSGLSLRDYAP